MNIPKIGVVVVVQNDAETIEKSLASYYSYVEKIVVSTDLHRGWSGEPITPDDTLNRIRAFDTDNKVTIITGDFYRYQDPMENDTYQRQYSADALAEQGKHLHWMMQIDADEVFLDFPSVMSTLRTVPWSTRTVYWNWIQIYNILPDGRLLVVTDEMGQPKLERFPLAHRLGIKLRLSRYPTLPKSTSRGRFNWEFQGGLDPSCAVLHYSWAKSEARMREKFLTWSHSGDFDTNTIFNIWKNSQTRWAEMKDFHPFLPGTWPALKPFTLADLQAHLLVNS